MKYLVDKAIEAKKNAYAIYSNFPVGCALEMNDGTIFLGSNVENVSFGGTICAERAAICTAISNGYTKGDFKAMAISANTSGFVRPCFICRQTFVEFFDKKMQVAMADKNGEFEILTVDQLAPHAFEGLE